MHQLQQFASCLCNARHSRMLALITRSQHRQLPYHQVQLTELHRQLLIISIEDMRLRLFAELYITL